MSTRRSTIPPAAAGPVISVLVLLFVAGCGSGTQSGPSAAGAGAEQSATGGASDLVGTWRTNEIPVERLRAMFRENGARPGELAQFSEIFVARNTVAFEVRVGQETWDQFEHDDGGPSMGSWKGTYTMDGDTVHAVDDAADKCTVDYRVTIHNSDGLALQVLDADADRPACGHLGEVIERTIFESAPFTRVG